MTVQFQEPPKLEGEPPRATMAELFDKFEELLKYDFVNIDREAMRQSTIYFEVQRQLQIQTACLQYLYQKQAKLKERRRLYYDNRLPQSYYKEEPLKFPPRNQTEMKECLEADTLLQEFAAHVSAAERRVKFCEDTLTEVKSRHWNLKIALDYRKMMEGL